MSAGVKSPDNPTSHTLLGLQVSTLGWNAALAHAQELALSQGKPATIAFLDEAKFAALLLGGGRDDRHHLLLPAGGKFLRLLLKFIWRKRPFEAAFTSAGFTSALLTYFAAPRRIGLVGDDKSRAEALCTHLARHAPWHEFVAIAPDTSLSGRLDLVIAEAAVAGRHMERRLEGLDIGLVIMAGRGLHGLARPLPVSTGTQPSISKPSLA